MSANVEATPRCDDEGLPVVDLLVSWNERTGFEAVDITINLDETLVITATDLPSSGTQTFVAGLAGRPVGEQVQADVIVDYRDTDGTQQTRRSRPDDFFVVPECAGSTTTTSDPGTTTTEPATTTTEPATTTTEPATTTTEPATTTTEPATTTTEPATTTTDPATTTTDPATDPVTLIVDEPACGADGQPLVTATVVWDELAGYERVRGLLSLDDVVVNEFDSAPPGEQQTTVSLEGYTPGTEARLAVGVEYIDQDEQFDSVFFNESASVKVPRCPGSTTTTESTTTTTEPTTTTTTEPTTTTTEATTTTTSSTSTTTTTTTVETTTTVATPPGQVDVRSAPVRCTADGSVLADVTVEFFDLPGYDGVVIELFVNDDIVDERNVEQPKGTTDFTIGLNEYEVGSQVVVRADVRYYDLEGMESQEFSDETVVGRPDCTF